MPQPKQSEPTVDLPDSGQVDPKDEAVEVLTVKDQTETGTGTTEPFGVPTDPPRKSSIALSTPRHDVPVAVSKIGGNNAHTPPDPKEFDEMGRPRL